MLGSKSLLYVILSLGTAFAASDKYLYPELSTVLDEGINQLSSIKEKPKRIEAFQTIRMNAEKFFAKGSKAQKSRAAVVLTTLAGFSEVKLDADGCLKTYHYLIYDFYPKDEERKATSPVVDYVFKYLSLLCDDDRMVSKKDL